MMQTNRPVIDFAQVAVGRVAELAKQIIAHYYGEPAQHSYFAGCSTGGREAMLMTQRYPAEFDGVISGDPAMRTGFSQIGNNWSAVAFNEIAPKDDSGRPQPNKVFSESDIKLIVKGVLDACDANDGLKDGMVFNTRACKFDPDVLACKAGKNDSCLTPQQTAAIKKAFAGPHNSRGELVYPMNAYDAGIANLLPSPEASPNRRAAGAPAPPVSIDVDQRLFALLGNPLEALTDTTWTNLSTFSAHGGKLLFYHGMSDQAFSAMDTLDYYQRMAKANGGMDKVQTWSRMFLVPGMYHCRGGEFALDNFDLLTAAGELGGERRGSRFGGRNREGFPRPQPALVRLSEIRALHRAKAIRKMRRTSNAANDGMIRDAGPSNGARLRRSAR